MRVLARLEDPRPRGDPASSFIGSAGVCRYLMASPSLIVSSTGSLTPDRRSRTDGLATHLTVAAPSHYDPV
jgi:hypothetical protein